VFLRNFSFVGLWGGPVYRIYEVDRAGDTLFPDTRQGWTQGT
jgi:hypothetical protein